MLKALGTLLRVSLRVLLEVFVESLLRVFGEVRVEALGRVLLAVVVRTFVGPLEVADAADVARAEGATEGFGEGRARCEERSRELGEAGRPRARGRFVVSASGGGDDLSGRFFGIVGAFAGFAFALAFSFAAFTVAFFFAVAIAVAFFFAVALAWPDVPSSFTVTSSATE